MYKTCNAGKGFIFLIILLQWSFGGSGQSPVSGNQLLRKEFKTKSGTVTCNLPGEIVKGDRIWMTATADPTAGSAKKTEQNANFLSGCQVKVGDKVFNLQEGGFLLKVPEQTGTGSLNLELLSQEGKNLGSSKIPVSDLPSFSLPGFSPEKINPVFPTVAEKGFPGTITGSFDGNAENTFLMIGNREAEILAESPRELYFQTPADLSGLHPFSLLEEERLFLGKIRLIETELTASRTNLRRGEKTVITIRVHGLKELDCPVVMEVQNLTPTVLSLEGGVTQILSVEPGSVPESGTWEKTLGGNSLTTGEFIVQVRVIPPPPGFVVPVSPSGITAAGAPLVFNWQSVNLPADQLFSLTLHKGTIPGELLPEMKPFRQFNVIQGTSYSPGEKTGLSPGDLITWQVTAATSGGVIRGIPMVVNLSGGDDQPKDTIPKKNEGIKDPCKDPWYVDLEKDQCQTIIDETVKPGVDGVKDQFRTFQSKWKDHFRELSLALSTFDMRLGMVEYWIGTGKEMEENAEKVQKFANLIGDGVDKGITAFKEGGEEALKEVVKGVMEDKVMEAEQNAASRLSEDLGVLYDLKDIAVRNIGLGIAKGLTGIYPDQKADFYRRALELSITELSSWISNAYAWNTGNTHPTLQEGIQDLNGMLNQLDQIEEDFDKAVKEAGFKCIKCEIPEDVMEEINKLRTRINEEMRKFGDTIDRITQRLNEGLAVVNNKRAYEDVARLGYYQGHSAKKTREIKRVLADCRAELNEARSVRKP